MRIVFCLLLLLPLSACNTQMPSWPEANNTAEITTLAYDGNGVPDALLQRAAGMTLRRGYSHFIIVPGKSARDNARPSIGFNYGRSPYGFGDAGSSYGASAEMGSHQRRMQWTIRMMNADEARGMKAYHAKDILK